MDKFKRYTQKLQKYFRVAGKWRWNDKNFEAEVWSRFWSWVLVIIGITFCDITWKQLLWWKHPTLWLCLWQCFINEAPHRFYDSYKYVECLSYLKEAATRIKKLKGSWTSIQLLIHHSSKVSKNRKRKI